MDEINELRLKVARRDAAINVLLLALEAVASKGKAAWLRKVKAAAEAAAKEVTLEELKEQEKKVANYSSNPYVRSA